MHGSSIERNRRGKKTNPVDWRWMGISKLEITWPRIGPPIMISPGGWTKPSHCAINSDSKVPILASRFCGFRIAGPDKAVSYTHLRAHETRHDLVCRLLLE